MIQTSHAPRRLIELRSIVSPSLGGALARVERVLLRPIDGAWLAAYRILFGITMAISMQRLLTYNWVESLIVGSGPRFRFHYWGFGWVEPLSLHTMNTLVWILMGLAIAIACGAAFRVASLLFAVGLTYIQLIDVSTYLNHYYLAGLLAWLFAFSPANRTWSIDRLLYGKSARASGTVPAAWLYVFRVQIAVVYLGAAIAKLQPDWLLHGQPLAIWIGARTHLPILGRLFTLPHVALVLSWLGFLFDATIVLWLSMKRTRPFAYAVVLLFHVFTRVLFDIGMFPFIMSISALVFFDPSWPRLGRRGVTPEVSRPPTIESPSTWKRVLLAIATVYCATQVIVPLRGFLYGGNINWHEQGMRFSWRVMVRAKGGATTFLVRAPSANRVYRVSPRDYLTPYQENEMSGQPDLILQLAHHIAHDFETRGFGADIEVRVESDVSLNGRRGAAMIDPSVDLTKIHDGLGLARYIMPAPTDPPPDIHPVL